MDEFAYPREGNSVFYEGMRSHIQKGGGVIRTSTSAHRFLSDESGRIAGVALQSGEELFASHVVSSMPLTLLLKGIDGVPQTVSQAAERLRFRNTILVYLLIEGTELFPDQWLYVHDESVQHGRITNFRNWSPGLMANNRETVLCLEFWCFEVDSIWSEDDDKLIRQAREEVIRTGLVNDETIRDGRVIRIPRCYPVYERGYREPLQTVTDWLDGRPGLTAIGRYGSFKYNNQDHSILMGILAAEAIGRGRPEPLWHVNTDSAYQEGPSSGALKDPEASATSGDEDAAERR